MNTVFTIKAVYSTGDSFNTYTTETILDYDWDSLDIVKKNVERIIEHNTWYKNEHSYLEESTPKPSFVNSEFDFSIYLFDKNGNEFLYGVPWIGYFEKLKTLEVNVVFSDIKEINEKYAHIS